jgi:hypothetical protein
MNEFIILLLFILIIFLITVRVYYLFNKSNDTTTIIPFSRFSKDCPSKIESKCSEHAMNLTCNQDICSNYHFHKISQANKRFNLK